VKRAGLLLALVLAGCGGGRPAVHTTVGGYSVYPADTIAASGSNPTSAACRRDARAFAHESVSFVAAHHGAFTTVDALYFTLREAEADFTARRCESKLLGQALARALPPARRRELLRDTPRGMTATIRAALRAAGA
jgi:hypothetical protein